MKTDFGSFKQNPFRREKTHTHTNCENLKSEGVSFEWIKNLTINLCWVIVISEKQTMGCSHRKDMLRISIFIINIFTLNSYFGLANNGTSSVNSPSPSSDCVPVSLVFG